MGRSLTPREGRCRRSLPPEGAGGNTTRIHERLSTHMWQSTYESEPPRHKLLELVVDKDALHVKLDGFRRFIKHVTVELEWDLQHGAADGGGCEAMRDGSQDDCCLRRNVRWG